jgi:hypothetical protein
VYDYATGTFHATTGSVSVANKAVMMLNGKVLIAGGDYPPPNANAWVYDPATNNISPLPSQTAHPRRDHVIVGVETWSLPYEVRIDPLRILLSESLYVKIRLPYPPPPTLLLESVREELSRMPLADRRRALDRIRSFAAWSQALEQELMKDLQK